MFPCRPATYLMQAYKNIATLFRHDEYQLFCFYLRLFALIRGKKCFSGCLLLAFKLLFMTICNKPTRSLPSTLLPSEFSPAVAVPQRRGRSRWLRVSAHPVSSAPGLRGFSGRHRAAY